MAEARKTITEVMRGQGGRNALARLAAAKLILGDPELLKAMPDEVLLAEVKRRREAAKGQP